MHSKLLWSLFYQRYGRRLYEKVSLNSNIVLSVFFCGICLPLIFSQLLLSRWLLIALLLSFIACLKYKGVFIFLAVFLFGYTFSNSAFERHQQRMLPSELETKNLVVTGTVEGLPVNRSGTVNFTYKIISSEHALAKGSLVKLSCYRCPLDFESGQTWQLTVRLKQPHGFASWGAFDYEKYLFRHRFIGKGYVRLKEENTLLESKLFSVNQFRGSIVERLNSNEKFSEPGLTMIVALMVGDKSMMTSKQSEVFQVTGVSHLMAISGLHIGLVFMVVAWLCKWLSYPFFRFYLLVPRQHLVLLPALLAALFYAALAGFAVSTTRALIMLTVFVVSKLLAREISLHKVLLIAACLIVLLDPFSILDTGFWLSCGAVWVIGLFSNFKGNDDKTQSLSLLRLQPLLWLGMLPMTAFFFGQVSLVSPLVNLLVVPLFCLLLIPATLLSLCLLIMGFSKLAFFLLSYLDHAYQFIYWLLDYLTTLDLTHSSTYQWSTTQTVLVLLALAVYYFRSKLIGTGVWGVMIVSLFLPSLRSSSVTLLDVALLDVGQGLSMVIEVKGRKNYTMVYDTGPKYPSGFSAAKAVLLPYLKSRGISHIDNLIISHADNDHIGGYTDLVENYNVKQVLTSRLDVLPNAKLCYAGQHWQVENVKFEILSPTNNTPEGSNNLSCVLKLSYAGTNVLITGDIEKQVERFLLKQYQDAPEVLKADIMLVPHQGSKTSSINTFIDAVQPQLALIAAGYLNHYGHPHAKVVARYNDRDIKLLSTVDNGSVIIKINDSGWRTVAFRRQQQAFWHHQKKPN